jgi:hypothetical protein
LGAIYFGEGDSGLEFGGDHQIKGMKMRNVSGILELSLLVLLLSPCSSVALWPEKTPDTRGEAAKEYAKEAVRDTADAAKNVGESIKQTANAAYETTADAAKTITGSRDSTGSPGAAYRDSAGRYVDETRGQAADVAGAVRDAASRGAQTITGGRQDHGSEGPTGAAYRDATGRYVADSASATQNKASEAAGAMKDTAARATQTVADTARAAGDRASRAATATKDAAADTAQAAKDRAAQAYDATADTVGSTKERVWGTPDSEKTYTQRAREMAAQTGETAQGHASYAGEKLSESAQAAADAARRAGQNVRDGAAQAYDSTTSTLGTPVRDQNSRGVIDKAGDYFQGAKESVTDAAGATKDSAYRTMGYDTPSDKGYASEAYEAGREKLGSIIEVLGWRKAAEHEHRQRSPYDVLVGNDRYVWHQRPGDESYYQKAKDTVGGATETTSEKASQAKDRTVDAASQVKDRTLDAASRAKDVVVDGANRAKESVRDATGQGEKTAADYSQRGKEAIGAGAAAFGAHRLAKTGRFDRVTAFLHLLAYAVTFGSAVWMTFFSGRILSRTIPREQFRNVQTKMFPYFLKFMVAGEAALTFLYALMNGFSSKWLFGLLFVVAATAFNAFVLEPQTTKIYLEKLKVEKEEGRGVGDNQSEKQKKFDEVHGFSAILNLLSLAGLTYHGWNMVPALSA